MLQEIVISTQKLQPARGRSSTYLLVHRNSRVFPCQKFILDGRGLCFGLELATEIVEDGTLFKMKLRCTVFSFARYARDYGIMLVTSCMQNNVDVITFCCYKDDAFAT